MDPEEVLAQDAEFFARRGENAWVLDEDNYGLHSRFGFGRVRVQTKADGSPDFDRLVVGEAPNINAVCFGWKDGVCYIAVVTQTRPFADNPDGSPADPPMRFAQPCIMGFLARIVGQEAAVAFESANEGAVREALEESGANAILGISEMGYHNPNPTFVASWSTLVAIQVNLDLVTEFTDKTELIYKAEYLPVREVLARIAEGEFEGVSYRSATANDALFVWLSGNLHAISQKALY